MGSALWNLIFFIIAIGILIAIHEAGHFFAARKCGVKVMRFSIGFGPVIWRKRGRDGTEYALSLFPLGGYVKMKGEAGDEEEASVVDRVGGAVVAESKRQSQDNSSSNSNSNSDADSSDRKTIDTDFAQLRSGNWDGVDDVVGVAGAGAGTVIGSGVSAPDDDSFSSKTIGQRALIIGAGPLCNIVLAFILYTVVNLLGVQTVLPVVGEIDAGSRAESAGLQQYDLIRSIDGVEVKNWQEAATEIITNVDSNVELVVAGAIGKDSNRTLTLNLHDLNITPHSGPFEEVGFEPCLGEVQRELALVQENSPAARVGLEVGDTILSVNGIPTPDWRSVQKTISSYPIASIEAGIPLTLEVQRGAEQFVVELLPELRYDDSRKVSRPMIGIGTMVTSIPELYTEVKYGPVDAMIHAASDTAHMSMVILNSAKQMISGALSAQNIGGPITLAKGAGASADIGLTVFLWFLATLSINLGVLNLLPIPILDGGQLVYLLYEKVTHRRPNERVQVVLTMISLGLVLGLTFLAIFNDLTQL